MDREKYAFTCRMYTSSVNSYEVENEKSSRCSYELCKDIRENVATETTESTEENVSTSSRSDEISDTPDGLAYKQPQNEEDLVDAKVTSEARTNVLIDAECYNMNHARRGIALIFNHVHFDNMPPRTGAMKDAKDLTKTFENLGFTVRYKQDPTYNEIVKTLKATAAEDHTDADCLIVTVMSHGSCGNLYTAKQTYSVEELWNPFTGEECPTLVGKPKLFFIQACRGDQFDRGVTVKFSVDVVDGFANSYTIPNFADILVAYSTYDGFYSWRNKDNGSWFIQAICEEFNINGRTRDLLTLMTFVNRRVAVDYRSYNPRDEKFDGNKQIPSFVSMLTRLVYFPEKI